MSIHNTIDEIDKQFQKIADAQEKLKAIEMILGNLEVAL